MMSFEVGDYVQIKDSDFFRGWAMGWTGRIVANPNPSNGCFRVRFFDKDKYEADFKPEWLTKINDNMSEKQAPYGVSYIAGLPAMSFDEKSDKFRLISKSVFRFRDIVDEMAKTYEKKQHDYGDSFGISVRKYGNIAALTRMSDKFNRIENLILNGNQQVKDESLMDSLKDLACYCVMTVMAIEANDFENVE